MVADEPPVVIGDTAGGAGQELDRVAGAALLRDGSVVVANSGTYELRFYSAGGTFVRAVGRQGQGPGEFAHIDGLCRIDGDSLLVWDSSQRRVSIFAPDGRFVRQVTLGALSAWGPSFDGTVVGLGPNGSVVVTRVRHPTMRDVLLRDSVIVYRTSPDGADLRRFLFVEGVERIAQLTKSPRLWVSWFRPFGQRAVVRMHRGALYVMSGAEPEVRSFDLNGEPIASWHGGVTPRVMTQAERDRFMADSAPRGGIAEEWRVAMQTMGFPDRVPAFFNIRVDQSGRIWGEWWRLSNETARRWTVYDPVGRVLGTVTRNVGDGEVLDIDGDRVAVRAAGVADVEMVRVYRVIVPRS
jgi:hypothetical protein